MRLLVNKNRSKDSFHMKEDSAVVFGLNLISDGFAVKLYLFLRSHTNKIHHFLNKSRGFLNKKIGTPPAAIPVPKRININNY
tara:strand:- start:806 stop:1051 length:246 start_codon:yes stop_codon:yes gene_type:complete